MKDPKDPGTAEIAEFTLPRRRGRPSTGNAKSAAQRVAESRIRKRETGNGQRRLDLWVSVEAFLALERLETHLAGVSKRSILERLIVEFQQQTMNGMSDKQFDTYINRNQLQK